MPRRVLGSLSTYDLFAKSMPGVVFLLGATTLYPYRKITNQPPQAIIGFNIPFSFANFVAILIIILLLGLLLGEGVHILGIVVEQIIYALGAWFIRNILAHFRVVYAKVIDTSDDSTPEETVRQELMDVSSDNSYSTNASDQNHPHILTTMAYVSSFLKNVGNYLERLYEKVEQRYWWAHNMFKGHRILFGNYIYWNYNDKTGPWEKHRQGKLFDEFVKRFQEEYHVDLRYEYTSEEIKRLYPLITSELSASGSGRAQKFQATYSFCRSMWVIFVLFTSFHLLILYPAYLSGKNPVYETVGMRLFSDIGDVLLIPFITLFITFIFMYGTGVYKRNYIEYLMADFCITSPE